jgi:tetratricopeptide (TPR) repeat protein
MMRTLFIAGVIVAVPAGLPAQAPDPPIADTRLAVHTLVREDVFAGFQQNDVSRLARAEKNIELLLESRPAERASLLAWLGSTALTRAVHANEKGASQEFTRHYRRAIDLFADAMREGPGVDGVFAVVGGTNASLADRLPETERKAAWEQGYGAYAQLWRLQSAIVSKLPVHHRGELLTGLAQTAQRSGRVVEASGYLDQILASLPDTPYAPLARQWKDDPASRMTGNLTCRTCHAPGTLVARMADVAKDLPR